MELVCMGNREIVGLEMVEARKSLCLLDCRVTHVGSIESGIRTLYFF